MPGERGALGLARLGALQAFAAALGVYAALSPALPIWLRVLVCIGCVAALVQGLIGNSGAAPDASPSKAFAGILAGALCLVLVVSAAIGFDTLANHHFVLTAFGLSVWLHRGQPRFVAREGESRAAAALLAALMAMAVVQKLASPVFVSGDYFAYLLSTGGLGGPVLGVAQGWAAVVDHNLALVPDFIDADNPAQVLALEIPFALSASSFSSLAQGFAVLVLFVELWLACVFALAHRHRVAAWSLAVFVIGLACMREEWVFGTTLCALGFAACDVETRTAERRLLGALGGALGIGPPLYSLFTGS